MHYKGLSAISNLVWASIFVLVTGGLNACKKDNNNPSPSDENNKPALQLVRSIEFDDGVTANMQYNTDSTLKEITYRYGNVSSSTIFDWENKQLKAFYDNRSLYKNTIYYGESGISHYVNAYKEIPLPSSFTMEYSYNEKNQITTLKRFTTNEAGTTLKATSTYYYNSSSALEKVETKENNAVYTHIIASYSDTVYFSPLLFIETTLSENYPVFNIPVLSRMNRYPAKIIRKVKLGNDATFVDKITENTVSATDKNITQIKCRITVPQMPSYDRQVVSQFKY